MEKKLQYSRLGQSINKLYDILQSNILMHHISNGLSIFFEILIYFFAFILLIFIIILPTDPLSYGIPINHYSSLNITYKHQKFEEVMMRIKLVMFVLILPFVGVAILLRRGRKKSYLIKQAFEEAQKLKDDYQTTFETINNL